MWLEETLGKRINHLRVEQIVDSNVNEVVSACPYCLTMFEDGIKEKGLSEKLKAVDLAEIVDKALVKK